MLKDNYLTYKYKIYLLQYRIYKFKGKINNKEIANSLLMINSIICIYAYNVLNSSF